MDSRSVLPDLYFAVPRQSGGGLRSALAAHCDGADVTYAALLEESGMVFADAGDESMRDHGETAALAVGAYHATQEVARRLGEQAFEGLCHEGKSRHFYISPVDGRFMLLSVFGNDTRLALVRASATRAAAALRQALADGAAAEPPPPVRGIAAAEGDFHITSDYFLPV